MDSSKQQVIKRLALLDNWGLGLFHGNDSLSSAGWDTGQAG
jgi:hypothetical protein